MRILGKIVRTLVLTALAIVAIFNSHKPERKVIASPIITHPTTAAVVDTSLN